MTEVKIKAKQSPSTYIPVFLFLLAAYVFLVFILPTNPATLERFDITEAEANLLNLTVVVPLIAVYLTALYGFVRFYNYVESIRKTKEGPYLSEVATGLMILAFGLPFTSIVSSVTSFVRYEYPELADEATMFRHYSSLLIVFAAFYVIARGIQGLLGTLRQKTIVSLPHFSLLTPIAIASIYTWLLVGVDSAASNTLKFYLPDWVLVLTVVIPYTYIWWLGLRAARQLYKYTFAVKGRVYRSAFKNITYGLAVILIISILLRFLNIVSEQLNRLSISPILMIIYALIILYAVGYGLVARGAKHLSKIEEV